MAIKEIITPRCCLAVQKLFSKLPQVNGYKSNSINTSRLLFGGNISSDTHQSRKSQIVSLRTGLKWNRTRPESVANIHSFITNRSSTALQPYKINLSGHSFSTTPISFIKNVEMGSYNPCSFDIVVIGAGIVGTATARQLSIRYPTYRFALLEKEERVAKHQSHNNSSVIHAGIYYPKHSKYAELCVRGCEMMYKYCKEKDIPYDRNGKLIVAQTRKECDDLLWLYQNSKSNNVVGVRIVDAKEIREIEPYAVGVRAIHSPNTGVVSYRMVTESLAKEFTDSGGRILFGFKVEGFGRNVGGSECSRIKYPLCIYGSGRCVNAKYAVVCAGLHADRLAGLLGGKREPMILPVRGRFLKLKDEYAYLIKGNIYPVPGKNNPFPGVHFTRRADGSVILGPAAFVAFSREGYKWHKISPRDLADMATYLGCYKVPFRFGASAWMEILGSLSTRIQMRFLRRYIPEMKLCYLEDAPPGVAALGVTADGFLEKDLIIEVIDSEDDIIGRLPLLLFHPCSSNFRWYNPCPPRRRLPPVRPHPLPRRDPRRHRLPRRRRRRQAPYCDFFRIMPHRRYYNHIRRYRHPRRRRARRHYHRHRRYYDRLRRQPLRKTHRHLERFKSLRAEPLCAGRRPRGPGRLRHRRSQKPQSDRGHRGRRDPRRPLSPQCPHRRYYDRIRQHRHRSNRVERRMPWSRLPQPPPLVLE